MTKLSIYLLFASVPATMACSGENISIPDSMRVTQLQTDLIARNVPAASAFSNLAALVAQGQHLATGFGVYRIKPPAPVLLRATARAATLGLPHGAALASNALARLTSIQNGDWTLTLNDEGDGEEYVDAARNHGGASTPESALAADAEFVAAAQGYAQTAFAAVLQQNSVYPYGVRKYFNAHSSNQITQIDGVYQVAVAFNTTIDDVPVIGAGGKLVVEMTSEKSVIRHEASVRQKGELIHVIAGRTDLLTPQVAEASVNARLDARGIDRSKFRTSRREFGYLSLGRGKIQTVLVPHYAFFFEPLPGTVSKVLVELEPATTASSVRALIATDDTADAARKAPLMAVPDTRTRR
jgi:hypothetical protein